MEKKHRTRKTGRDFQYSENYRELLFWKKLYFKKIEKQRKIKNIVLNAKNTIYITFQISCIHVRAKSKLFTFTDKINT